MSDDSGDTCRNIIRVPCQAALFIYACSISILIGLYVCCIIKSKKKKKILIDRSMYEGFMSVLPRHMMSIELFSAC